jgi:hypothetical protein
VTNLYAQEFEGEYRGSSTFNSITSMGLVGNLTVPGGIAGAALTTSGGTNGTYWNSINNVVTTAPVTNYTDMAVTGVVGARYALGGSSTTSFGSVTTPAGWMVGKNNTGLVPLGSATFSGSTPFPVELCDGSNQRGAVYARPGWSKSDFLRRDYPLLVEASYVGATRSPAPDWINNTTGGMWLTMGSSDVDLNRTSNNINTSGFWYPVFGFSLYDSFPCTSAAIAVSSTNPRQDYINSKDACPVQLYNNVTSNIKPVWPPIVQFPGGRVEPVPLGGQLQVSKPWLMGNNFVKLGIMYVWPSNDTKRYMHYFFNDNLIFTHGWVPDGRDWIDAWGRDDPFEGETYTDQIPKYVMAGAGTSDYAADINLHSMTFQSGQSLYYSKMNSLSTMNMQS